MERVLKTASLLFLLGNMFGCATLQSIPGMETVSNTVQDIMNIPTGQVRNTDPYCDAHEEVSYKVTNNVVSVVISQGVQIAQKSNYKSLSISRTDMEKMAKSISNEYLWMPVNFERVLGNHLHKKSMKKENYLLGRKSKRNRRLYAKADAALDIAKKDYTQLPYEASLYIVSGDQINAEALPAGYIYVTRTAVNDLDDNALQLVLGHEMAHIAKRHTSKQIQQRLLDTGLAAEMLQYIIEHRSMDNIDKIFAGDRVVGKFNGIFAEYDQGQELQADACSIRGMLSAGTDPLKAREEYLRKRGTHEAAEAPRKSSSRKPFGLGYTNHPEDEARDRFFQEAYRHHLRNIKAAALRH